MTNKLSAGSLHPEWTRSGINDILCKVKIEEEMPTLGNMEWAHN